MNKIIERGYDFFSRYHDKLLRISLAIIYIWFGILKPFHLSPANELATKTIPFIPAETFIWFLGIWETSIGLTFLFPKYTNLAFVMMLLHMAGTFLPLITLTDITFTHFPYAPTLEGQYIVKNLALIGIALTIWLNYWRQKGNR